MGVRCGEVEEGYCGGCTKRRLGRIIIGRTYILVVVGVGVDSGRWGVDEEGVLG